MILSFIHYNLWTSQLHIRPTLPITACLMINTAPSQISSYFSKTGPCSVFGCTRLLSMCYNHPWIKTPRQGSISFYAEIIACMQNLTYTVHTCVQLICDENRTDHFSVPDINNGSKPLSGILSSNNWTGTGRKWRR